MNEQQHFPNEIRSHFNLRKPHGNKPSIIYFVVRIAGRQFKIPTGVKVYPCHWNKKQEQALISTNISNNDNNNNRIANAVIARIKLAFTYGIEEWANSIVTNSNSGRNELELIDMIKKSLHYTKTGNRTKGEDVFEVLKRCIMNDPVKEGTKGTYGAAIDKFHEFVRSEHVRIDSFNDITKEVLVQYQTYLRNIKGQKGTADGSLSASYINELIKRLLQRLYAYAVRDDLMDRAVYERAKCIKPIRCSVRFGENAIALRDDEIIKLFNYKCKCQADEDVKNMFCFNCCVGQRISDLSRLNECIHESDGMIKIHLKQKKSGNYVDVPLKFQLAADIIAMYPNGLPLVTSNKMNSRIKRIAKEAGVGCEKIHIVRQSGNDSTCSDKEDYRYNQITSHTCRRTLATLLSLRGYTAREIADYSGHADMRMVEHYAKTTAALRAEFEHLRKTSPESILKEIGEADDTPPIGQQSDISIGQALKSVAISLCGLIIAVGRLFSI